MDNGIDYPWMDEMFIYTIHRTVHYSWTAIVLCSIIHGQCKMNINYPWIVEYSVCV